MDAFREILCFIDKFPFLCNPLTGEGKMNQGIQEWAK